MMRGRRNVEPDLQAARNAEWLKQYYLRRDMPTYEEPDAALPNRSRTVAMMELRLGFKMHGFDVGEYTDDQVSGAIVMEALASTDFSRDLFTRAFERLQKSS